MVFRATWCLLIRRVLRACCPFWRKPPFQPACPCASRSTTRYRVRAGTRIDGHLIAPIYSVDRKVLAVNTPVSGMILGAHPAREPREGIAGWPVRAAFGSRRHLRRAAPSGWYGCHPSHLRGPAGRHSCEDERQQKALDAQPAGSGTDPKIESARRWTRFTIRTWEIGL